MESLKFNPACGQMKSCTEDGRTIRYMAYENIPYCTHPEDSIQKLNLFVPDAYLHGESINGYTASTAPIFCPNTVGGYMPGPADEPGRDFQGRVNSIFNALEHGYVVMSAGVRGRTSGKKSDEFFEGSTLKNSENVSGILCGKAPAFAVDMKAAIRWLRENKDLLPAGDTEKIIVSGTSAGGALAALTGASGNQKDYEPYLKEIGAASQRDDVFAASCYCPIHNLEHADAAYEWLFANEDTYHRTKKIRTENGLKRVKDVGEMTPLQKEVSVKLKDQFPAYVNSLHLKDENGTELTLDHEGNGTFRDYVAKKVLESAAKEKEDHHSETSLASLMIPGSEVDQQVYFTKDGLDFDNFVKSLTRMKAAPAFDDLACRSPENEEFGTPEIPYLHFTDLSAHYSLDHAPKADEKIIAMMNPLTYIGEEGCAKNWRIRHGVYDRDTSLAIPVILSLVLKNHGYDTDFFLPWGLPHSGDYDLDELFAWIDDHAKSSGIQPAGPEASRPRLHA